MTNPLTGVLEHGEIGWSESFRRGALGRLFF